MRIYCKQYIPILMGFEIVFILSFHCSTLPIYTIKTVQYNNRDIMLMGDVYKWVNSIYRFTSKYTYRMFFSNKHAHFIWRSIHFGTTIISTIVI